MDRITYLLSRYLDNECTRQEMDELLDHIARHPEDERLRDALQKAWDSEDPIVRIGDRFIGERQRSMPSPVAGGKAVDARAFAWRVAACILVLAVGFSGFFFWQRQRGESLTADASVHAKAVTTSNGEHRLTVLPDGSKIWINNNSKVSYERSFNDKTREVILEGEAYFDIASDPRRPFIIRTGTVSTIVLGTAFNIRAFPNENTVTVTVARGTVRVQDENNKSEIITANQQLTVDLRSTHVEEHVVNAVAATQWVKEDLILHEVTFGEVEEMLEERYSVDIQFDNERLKKCRFTSTFFQNASLDEVITAICLVNGASYDTSGNVITIHGEGCDDERPGAGTSYH